MPAKKCSKFKNARAKLSFRQLVLLHRHVLVARRRRGPLPCRRVIIPMTLTKMSMRAHIEEEGYYRALEFLRWSLLLLFLPYRSDILCAVGK